MSLIVETKDLTRRYGKTLALDSLNLAIPTGAIYGFIGPNGAGKTTTMRILTTLLAPTSGDAWIAGASIHSDIKAVRAQVGFMPDFFGVYDSMTSWEYLDFFGRAFHVPAERRLPAIEELLALVDLSHKRDEYVMGLSRGMKQRLSLARTMIHDPKLLILDEPASGLDPRARIELRELLKELSALGKTIMISSHILTELAKMCTHIGIIEQGRLLASGDVNTIMNQLKPHVVLNIRVLSNAARAREVLSTFESVSNIRISHRNGEDTNGEQDDPAYEAAIDPEQTYNLLVDFQGDEQSKSHILTTLIQNQIPISLFQEQASNLEDIFMQVTQGIVQ